MHRRRLQACERAREKLDAKKKISDEDVLEVLRMWPFGENRVRKNVIPLGQEWVYSDTFGLIHSRSLGTCVESQLSKRYSEVMLLVSRWVRDRGPKRKRGGKLLSFPFTSINLNFSYAAKKHRDRFNLGPSLIRALGEFDGGELGYFPDDDATLPVEFLPMERMETIDIRRAFRVFDGRRGHCVQEFIGERFSVVFFSCRSYRAADADLRRRIAECGATWPSDDSNEAFTRQIPVARGYPDVVLPYGAAKRRGAATQNDSEEEDGSEDEDAALLCNPSAAHRRLRRKTASGPADSTQQHPLQQAPDDTSGAALRPADVTPAAEPAEAPDDAPKAAATRRYRLLRHPHLALGLKLQNIYTQGALVKRCKGDLSKLTAMRRKLADPATFEPLDD